MKTVVITGATSFLGRSVLKKLLDADYDVYAFVRDEKAFSRCGGERLHIVKGNLDNIEIILRELTHADYFIHFAWDGSGNAGRADRDTQLRNIDYSMRALNTAKTLGCNNFIFSGSQAEYGAVREIITENLKCNPVSEYGKAKLAFSEKAAKFCENNNMNFMHLRIFSVYGPGDRTGTLTDLCVRGFNSGKKVTLGPCSQKWNYLFIDDFSDIVLRLMQSGCKSGIYNIASGDTRILREYVMEIYDLSDKSGEYEFGQTAGNPEGSPSLEPCIDKLNSTIGDINYTSFADGIKSIMKALKQEV